MSAKPGDTLFDFDLAKYMGDLKFPLMDVEVLMTGQRRNLEALAQANRVAYDGFQAMVKRQAEIMRDTLDDVGRAAKDITEPGSAQDKAARQAELAKGAVTRGMGTMRELADMIAKTNTDALDLLHRRFADGMDEWRDALAKTAKH
jgi:phasin family protein